MYALLYMNTIIGYGENREEALIYGKLEAKLCIQHTVRDCKQRGRQYDPLTHMLIPTTRKVYEFIKSDIDQANKMFRNQDLVLLNNEIKRKKFKTKLTTFDEMIKQISSNTSLKLSATMMIKDV
tara:strand:- start:153 stop:524 length:372 start_codon:yes stop_codon:yes gene_type:complete